MTRLPHPMQPSPTWVVVAGLLIGGIAGVAVGWFTPDGSNAPVWLVIASAVVIGLAAAAVIYGILRIWHRTRGDRHLMEQESAEHSETSP